MAGLARHLGVRRTTLSEYCSGKRNGITGAWFDVLKDAWTAVEEGYEALLHAGRPVGAIFALKQLGWTDETRQVVDLPDLREAANAIRQGFGDLLEAVRQSQTPVRIDAIDVDNDEPKQIPE